MTSPRGEAPRQQQKQGHSRCQWLETLHGALLRAGPPCLGSGGLWGHRAKRDSNRAAREAKPSPMAEQGWRPLPQLCRAQQRRTQHFLRHGELTDSLGGYKSELKSRGWTGCLGTRNLSPRKGGLRKALSAIIFIIFSSGSLGSRSPAPPPPTPPARR